MKNYFTKLIGEWNGVVFANHKLFLCSRDIKTGDSLRNPIKGMMETPLKEEEIFWIKAQNSLVEEKDRWYKIVGEVAPEAIGVKEGDEFDENELPKLL